MKTIKIIILAFLLVSGAGCVCAAAWIYGQIAGLFCTGGALLIAALLLSEVFRDDGNG